jgi:hypothetical protein
MRIYYDDPTLRHIRVDRAGLTAFLREQGMPEHDIKRLCIRLRPQMPKGYPSKSPADQVLGSFNLRNTVYVCTQRRAFNARDLNRTLLHELRHFMKRGYQPGETKIAYWDRPSEVDARQFAGQHSQRLFISTGEAAPLPILPVQPMQSPATISSSAVPVAVSLPSSTRKRTTIAGAALALVGLGVVLLKPLWHREVQHA